MDGIDERTKEQLGQRILSIGGPTGVGKDTVVNCLLATYPQVVHFPRTTTRPKRNGEVDGRDYFFVDEAEFTYLHQREVIKAVDIYTGFSYGIDCKKLIEKLAENGRRIVMVGGICGVHLRDEFFSTMGNVYLVASAEEICRRLEKRVGDPRQVKKSFDEAMERFHAESQLFDQVIDNPDCHLRQTVATVAQLMGLPPMEIVIKEVSGYVGART